MKIEPKNLEAKVYTLKGWIEIVDPEILVDFFQTHLEKAKFNILNYTSNTFPNNGFTAVWVLAESHLALHSFAESGWTYLELTSCNLSKSKVFKKLLLNSYHNIKLDKKDFEESKI
jgi:S-adenosylmethionine decarboxylase